MYFGQTRPEVIYNRQIRYLDFMENGVRTKGAGFVKLEREGQLCQITLQISGLYRKDRFTRPLLLVDEKGEYELCKLNLADGGIKICLERLDCNNLSPKGLHYDQIEGLRIPISENKEICCMWGMSHAKEAVISSGGDKKQIQNPVWEVVDRQKTEPIMEGKTDTTPSKQDIQTDMEEAVQPGMHPNTLPIRDSKWEQLWEVYPHSTPFGDDREYLDIGPSDFVILSERNYKLVNNSFLLHGYYNYKHLILTRVRERNQMRFYIGVPGVFAENEKRTAIMFGFKSFECAMEPAKEGDFGYYMVPVEL